MRRFLSLVLGFAYVVPLTGFVLFRGIPTYAPWWLDLANTFTLYLFIPTLVALLLGLLLFSRSILLVSVPPVLLFVFLYGGLFLPRHLGSPAQGTTLTIMTHNIYAMNRNANRMAQVIAEANPDIVALQELTDEMAEGLTARLGNTYPYLALVPRADASGVGIFSRFPISTEESFTAGHMSQHAVLYVEGQAVHLFNSHPLPPKIRVARRQSFPPYFIRGFDTDPQTIEVEAIVEKVREAEGPIILTGDFNITDQSRQYGQITADLTDVYRETGWGFGHTFPASGRLLQLPLVPLFRIDYIFHSSELIGLEIHTGDNTGSDHLPVVARLSLKNTDNR